MNRLDDLAPFGWILKNTGYPEDIPSSKSGFVSHCVPKGFAAYCKLFHPIHEDMSVDRNLTYEDQRGLEVINRKIEFSITTGKTSINENERRIRWKELAERYHLQFHPEMDFWSFTRNFPGRTWPVYLDAPAEGTLEANTCKRLVQRLHPFTNEQACYFHYDLIATENLESDLLFVGKLMEVLQTKELEDVRGTPTHWWPEDRSWCVFSDWDFSFTLVAGPVALIESLINDDMLECLKVGLSSRIDYKGDRINP